MYFVAHTSPTYHYHYSWSGTFFIILPPLKRFISFLTGIIIFELWCMYLHPQHINKYCKDNYPTSIIKNLVVIKLLIYIKARGGVFDHFNENWCNIKEVKLVHLWNVKKEKNNWEYVNLDPGYDITRKNNGAIISIFCSYKIWIFKNDHKKWF